MNRSLACFAATAFVLLLSAVPGRAAGSRLHPVVVSEADGVGFVIGGTVGGEWVSTKRMVKLMRGGERYKMYQGYSYSGSAIGGKPSPSGNDHFTISFPMLSPGFDIAISGVWNAAPRKPHKGNPRKVEYLKAVQSILNQRGMRKSIANVTSVSIVDLEGDGRKETIICAKSRGFDPYTYRKNDYSMLLLLRTPKDGSRIVLITGEFHKASKKDGYPEYHDVWGFWDVDGDGKLEVLASALSPKGDWARILLYKVKGASVVLQAEDALAA